MLRVQSFDIMDSDGMNKLLSHYRLATGAHILVSEGKVCIPYEDGEPDNKQQQIIIIAEQRNKMLVELSLIEHSQKVMAFMEADAKDRANAAEAEWKGYTSSKQLEERKNVTAAALVEIQNKIKQNEYEIIRLKKNIEIFEETMKELEA